MSSTAQAACNCMGKLPGCTCAGRCACACTCKKTYFTDDFGNDTAISAEPQFGLDWMTEADPNEGQVMHRTKGGKGAIGQALAKYKKLPPNCS